MHTAKYPEAEASYKNCYTVKKLSHTLKLKP